MCRLFWPQTALGFLHELRQNTRYDIDGTLDSKKTSAFCVYQHDHRFLYFHQIILQILRQSAIIYTTVLCKSYI